MINHGLSTGGLFAVVGMLYERYHTREIADLGGLARRTPRLAALAVVLVLASIGLPGLNGFAGELLLLKGMFQRAWSGPIGPWTAQYLARSPCWPWRAWSWGPGTCFGWCRRSSFGPLRQPHLADASQEKPVADLCFREMRPWRRWSC